MGSVPLGLIITQLFLSTWILIPSEVFESGNSFKSSEITIFDCSKEHSIFVLVVKLGGRFFMF